MYFKKLKKDLSNLEVGDILLEECFRNGEKHIDAKSIVLKINKKNNFTAMNFYNHLKIDEYDMEQFIRKYCKIRKRSGAISYSAAIKDRTHILYSDIDFPKNLSYANTAKYEYDRISKNIVIHLNAFELNNFLHLFNKYNPSLLEILKKYMQ